ncbi:MAG: hypothetical protein GY941_13245 [Planctomycetes bacterium]|nr:hypothetical protein [Planctomycetota bacterium]
MNFKIRLLISDMIAFAAVGFAISTISVYSMKFLKPGQFVAISLGMMLIGLLISFCWSFWYFVLLVPGIYLLCIPISTIHYCILDTEKV